MRGGENCGWAASRPGERQDVAHAPSSALACATPFALGRREGSIGFGVGIWIDLID
jgi:hypothetical protein